MKLPVVVRRFLGLHVNGPKPGFKKSKVLLPFASLNIRGKLEDVPHLIPMTGLLVRESVLNRRYKNWDTAKATIRGMVKGGSVSVRRVIGRGANDVLILRTR